MIKKNILLYIIYGDDLVYYNGAKFSLLSFLSHCNNSNKPEVIVLTEHPDFFSKYPVTTYLITPEMKQNWSMNGKYHFRIKNRGMDYIGKTHPMEKIENILFMDADTYFTKDPTSLFNLITEKQVLLFFNEGKISNNKKCTFKSTLTNKTFNFKEYGVYQLQPSSCMWGSLMIGIKPDMLPLLEDADRLMRGLMTVVGDHTVEQFSLSETLQKEYILVEGKKFVSHYSTSGKKTYAKKVLHDFFEKNSSLSYDEQIKMSKNVSFSRPILTILKKLF